MKPFKKKLVLGALWKEKNYLLSVITCRYQLGWHCGMRVNLEKLILYSEKINIFREGKYVSGA